MLNKQISKLPPELRLMLASANSDLGTIKYLLQQDINWDNFLRLSEHHRVYPSVYETFIQLDKSLVPDHVLDVMTQACRENTMNTLRIAGETVRIGNLMEKQNINAVVLKGAPLSYRLYGDISARPYCDIDMLVATDKLEESIAILEKEGYCRISKYDSYDLTPRQMQIYLKQHRHSSHYEYWNSEKKVLLEIHWKLSKYNNVLPLPSEGSIKKMVALGNTMQVLSDEECLLYLVLHGTGHRWHRLRWLVDINRYIQQVHIDWVGLERLAQNYGIALFLHQALILVNYVFGVSLPLGLERNVVRDRLAWRMARLALQALILDSGDQAGSSSIYNFYVINLYNLYISRGLKNKLKYVLKLFGPTVEDIKMITLPERLFAFYYIVGPFTLITRRLQRLIVKNKND